MRNAKLLLLSIVTAVSALGCTIQTRNGIKEVPYDYSDYAYYDKPFNASPNYQEARAETTEARTPAAPPAAKPERGTSNFPRTTPATAGAAGVHRTHAAHAGSSLFDAGASNTPIR
jgi:hypothetical protein